MICSPLTLRWPICIVFAMMLHMPARADDSQRYFAIQVIDDQTGRGVPLVELRTTNSIRYYTDSNGIVAFHEPGLMGRDVFFHISGHGYEYPRQVFDYRGLALGTEPGGREVIRIKRINIAERLYRMTGQGIYRDSVLVGEPVLIAEPVLNGEVMGQDSVQNAIYRGKLYWFWGDTVRAARALGQFKMSGATSLLPADGGLDPDRGVDLTYFVDEDGFSREMAPLPAPGMYWLDGLMVLPDETGRQRLVAAYGQVIRLGETISRGLAVYNDELERFDALVEFELDNPLRPVAHPVRVTADGEDYFYFPQPYPDIRVRARWEDVVDQSRYEAFTCLRPGSRYDKDDPPLDRDADGRLIWAWKQNTAPLSYAQQRELLAAGAITEQEAWWRLREAGTGRPIHAHTSSVNWNPFRGKWIMIMCEIFGESSVLGEIWYAEADSPEGPWTEAVKIATHDRYSFYNVKQHPYFDQEGGRIIYFEGTYTGMFSRQEDPTPRYDYNQIMYRLDLADERLRP